jgi:signal transduction histidine kinase
MFLHRLNRLLLAMGLIAVIGGTVLVFLISHTFTQPLKTLVAGVRSLEKGDFAYPLKQQGDDEITEVTGAFDRMRRSLRATQQQLLEAERLATIGTMASSISHDLRHSLTAVVANAEFLCESSLTVAQKEELYHEIRVAVDQMTDMIESLLEFSRTPESLRRSPAKLDEVVRRAASAVRAHPQGQGVAISVSSSGPVAGVFDQKKLQRVFYNLLLNACEATRGDGRRVEVTIQGQAQKVEIRVCDNGTGIPEAVRDRLFQPFVSSGKENGTGMGLAVVQKIVQDHGGDIVLESTSPQGSIFKITLPLVLTADLGREPSPLPFVREHAG